MIKEKTVVIISSIIWYLLLIIALFYLWKCRPQKSNRITSLHGGVWEIKRENLKKMNQTTKQQLLTLTNIMRRKVVNEDLTGIESINVGSAYKSKDEIIETVSTQAREARRFQYFCLSCMDWLTNGGTIQSFIDNEIDEFARTNQPEEDRIAKRQMLDRLAEDITEIYPEEI
jgi:hypothetical protein